MELGGLIPSIITRTSRKTRGGYRINMEDDVVITVCKITKKHKDAPLQLMSS